MASHPENVKQEIKKKFEDMSLEELLPPMVINVLRMGGFNIKLGYKSKNASGFSPLLWCTFAGATHALSILLEAGADPNEVYIAQDPLDTTRFSSIHLAAMYNHPDCLKLLIKHGVNVDQEAGRGSSTPLQFACEAGWIRCVRVLLQNKASLNPPNNPLMTRPLHLAVLYRHKAVVKLLLEKNADPNFMQKQGCRPLDLLFYGPDDEYYSKKNDEHVLGILDLLVQHKADVNLSSHIDSPFPGRTPLMFAIRSKSLSQKEIIIQRLLFHKADPNIVDNLQFCSLTTLIYNFDNLQIMRLLLRNDADLFHICQGHSLLALVANKPNCRDAYHDEFYLNVLCKFKEFQKVDPEKAMDNLKEWLNKKGINTNLTNVREVLARLVVENENNFFQEGLFNVSYQIIRSMKHRKSEPHKQLPSRLVQHILSYIRNALAPKTQAALQREFFPDAVHKAIAVSNIVTQQNKTILFQAREQLQLGPCSLVKLLEKNKEIKPYMPNEKELWSLIPDDKQLAKLKAELLKTEQELLELQKEVASLESGTATAKSAPR